MRPTLQVICSGIVTVRFTKRDRTIASKKLRLRPDCSYRSRVSLRSRSILRRGVLSVLVKFEGNLVLLPKSATTRRVRAG